jgi:hypothetical protein
MGRPNSLRAGSQAATTCDGTSVYMTQDIGTAKLRFDDYPIDTMIYVVGMNRTIISRYFPFF